MSKKTTYILVALVMAASLVGEVASVHMHQPHWWPLPFGYNLAFGFVGCWVLIIMAKMLMMPLLQRDEDYYDRGDNNE